jgi:hypothetical protein
LYCWLFRIGVPHPISEAALGGGGAPRTITYSVEVARAPVGAKPRPSVKGITDVGTPAGSLKVRSSSEGLGRPGGLGSQLRE